MSDAPAFKVERQDVGDAVVVSPQGELDLATEPQLREVLVEACREHRSVVIDMNGLSFIDSSGLGLFVIIWKWLKADGCTMVLAAPREVARNVLEITHLDNVIPVHATREEALNALAGRAEVG